MTPAILSSFIPLFSLIVIVFILAFVLGNRYRHDVTRAFYLLFISYLIMTFSDFFNRLPFPEIFRQISMHISGFLTATNGFLFLNFIFAVANKPRNSWYYMFGVIAAAAGLLSLLPFVSIATDIAIGADTIIIPSTYTIIIILTASMMPGIYSTVIGWMTFRRTRNPKLKKQLFILLSGLGLAALFVLTVLIVLPAVFNYYGAVTFSSLGIVFLALSIYYAVSRYKFLAVDIEQVQAVSERLFANMTDAVIILDAGGSVVQMNDAAITLLKCGEDLPTPAFLSDHIKDYDIGTIYKSMKTTVCSGNEERIVLISQSTMGESDISLGKVIILRDITEQIQAAESLREQEEQFRALAENSSDTIMRFDRDLRHIYVNPMIEKQTGIPRDSIIGKRHRDLDFPPGLVDVWEGTLRRVFDSGNMERIEFQLPLGFWIDWLCIPEFDREGNVHAVITSSRDITDRKKIEELVRLDLVEKESLLKEIHHRVKNNLQVISSLIGLQLDRMHEPEDRALLEGVRNSVLSMAIIHQKLYQTENFARIDMKDYIRELVSEIFNMYYHARGLTITYNVDDVYLKINEAVPCGLIINELVTNAIKHAFPDSRTGTIRVTCNARAGSHVISVHDDGAGLPSDFNSARPASLGLQLVAALVKQLRGTMEVITSEGTEFRITF